MAIFGITREVLWIGVPLLGFFIGDFFDQKETLRMIRFRDKSSLYGRTLKEGEEPSWP